MSAAPTPTPRAATPGERLDDALLRIGAFARAHRTAVIALAVAVVLGGLGATAVALGGGAAGAHPPVDVAVSAPPRTTPTTAPRAQPAEAGSGDRIRTCTIGAPADDPWLGALQASIVDLATGEVRFDRAGAEGQPVGGGQRVLTAAAALAVLGPDFRIPTLVVKGVEPGTVVLVGGGDLTLSRTRTGSETVYPGAAHLDALAEQVRSTWYADPANGPLRTVLLDASRLGEDDWNPDWDPGERAAGTMPRLSALSVDGDRDDPFAIDSPRGEDPVQRAGRAFAELLGVHDVHPGTAADGAALLGSVESPDVAQLVDTMLRYDDAGLAETLARITAIRAGAGAGFDAVQSGLTAGLAEYGIPSDGLALVDGSGRSSRNAVPAATLTALLQAVAAGTGELTALDAAIPVSGRHESPTLRDRFTGAAALDPGAVRAVAGSEAGVASLTGFVTGDDGTVFAVAVAAHGELGPGAPTALDALLAAAAHCGGNLAGP